MEEFNKLTLNSNGVVGFRSTFGQKGTIEMVESSTETELPAEKVDKNVDTPLRKNISVSKTPF